MLFRDTTIIINGMTLNVGIRDRDVTTMFQITCEKVIVTKESASQKNNIVTLVSRLRHDDICNGDPILVQIDVHGVGIGDSQ